MRSLGSRLIIVVASGHQVLLATASTSISGCSSVTVSGAGLSSGTYRSLSSTSFYMAAGTDYHELYYSSNAWYIDPYVAGYPKYRTYDEVTDPTEITLDWAECDSSLCDWDVVAAITITCADTSSTSSSSVSTTTACTSITIEDFGIFTGTYREISATTYDELYYRAGGMDYYYVYLSGSTWYIDPVVAGYPQYRTFDDAAHPVDLTLGWAECGSSLCDWDEPAPSPIVISCADTTEDEAAASTCTSVTVSDFGDFTGTYRNIAASSYDAYYYMAAGIDYYYLYLDGGAWTLLGNVADYPQYRTYDDATHPADITQAWAECGSTYCDWDQPSPSPLNFTCADTSSSSGADATVSTCSSVTISDWDDFTGTYTETASISYDKYFAMSGGTDTYSLYVDDGAWYLEPDDAGYPKYRTFDDADHPADITLDWAVCDTTYCDWDVPTTSAVPIACEGSSSDATSSSTTDEATSTTDTTDGLSSSPTVTSSSSPTVTSGTDVVTSTDAETLTSDPDVTTTLDETDDPTPTPEPSSSSSNSGAPTSEDTTSPPAATESAGDGEDDSGDSLSAGAIAAISAVALALVGGGLGFAFKHNSIHCCSRQHISNSSVA